MIIFPSINKIVVNEIIYAFDKLDGSNIRAEWTRKNGFNKFGTRRRLLDRKEEPLGEAIPLFEEKYAEDLSKLFVKERFEKATVFFEFYGENSFAGNHEDEPHKVTLFDIHVHKKGLLEPKTFLKLTKNIETAKLLYHGKANSVFVEQVKTGQLEGMTFEGVICKGSLTKHRTPLMFKIKNEAWLLKLKEKFSHEDFLKLS